MSWIFSGALKNMLQTYWNQSFAGTLKYKMCQNRCLAEPPRSSYTEDDIYAWDFLLVVLGVLKVKMFRKIFLEKCWLKTKKKKKKSMKFHISFSFQYYFIFKTQSNTQYLHLSCLPYPLLQTSLTHNLYLYFYKFSP